jgi:hypothetical protein
MTPMEIPEQIEERRGAPLAVGRTIVATGGRFLAVFPPRTSSSIRRTSLQPEIRLARAEYQSASGYGLAFANRHGRQALRAVVQRAARHEQRLGVFICSRG